MKKIVIQVLKIGIPLGIVAWLVVDVQRNDPQTFALLAERPKNWPLLSVASVLVLTAVWLTFLRWWLLVRALGLPFRLRDAMRLGALGYLLNFVSAGSVGGDLFKAFFIARQIPHRRPEAVATVIVDRLVGLYALLLLTSLALLAAGQDDPKTEVVAIARITHTLSIAGAVGIALVSLPGFSTGPISEILVNLPKLGGFFARLIDGVRMYRRRPGQLAIIGLMSLGVHGLFATALFLAAGSLFHFTAVPTLAEHLVIVPLGMVTGALPLTPGGLGAFEYAMDFLYTHVPAGDVTARQGLVVALAFRVMTIVIACIGLGFYLAGRKELSQVMHEAEAGGASSA